MSKPKKIIIHWTAGGTIVNSTDRKHYHFIFDGSGKMHKGRNPVEANCPIVKGRPYAAHCGGGNSWTAGYALCGGPRGYKFGEITRLSFERMCFQIAKDVAKWEIPLSKNNVMTHYEFGLANPKTTSAGKVDISSIPWKPELKPSQVGDYIRSTINWYLKNKVLSKPTAVLSPIPDNGEED